MEQQHQIIQSLWIGKVLSNIERLCISSYIKQGHVFHLYTYDVIEDLPAAVILQPADSILPRDRVFRDATNGFTGFADWFRYKLLYEKGGWWVDMDTVCLRYFDFPEASCFASEYDPDGTAHVTNAFIRSPARSEVLADCLNYIELRGLSGINGPGNWGELGPTLLSDTLKKYPGLAVQPPEVFCPVNYFDFHRLIASSSWQPSSRTYAVHLWNDLWKRAYINRNAVFHPQSVFERLKRALLDGYDPATAV